MSLDDQQSLKRSPDAIPLVRAPLLSNGQPYLVEKNRPWLYSAVLGNGRLLACLDANGSLAQLFYPHLDAGPHLHAFFIGVQISSAGSSREPRESEHEVLWLMSADWTHQLNYIEGAAVVHCLSTHSTLPIQVDQEIFVHHTCDALINEIKCVNTGDTHFTCKLIVFAGFDFDYRQSKQTSYFNQDAASLTFFADDRYVSITCNKACDGFDCERSSIDDQDGFFQQVSRGQFAAHAYAIGRVQGAVRYSLGQIEARETSTSQIQMCFGGSFADLATVAALFVQTKPQVAGTVKWWQEKYQLPQSKIRSAIVNKVYNRSLITLKLLTDAQTGGIVAAPEFDPDFQACGGYGFCWPRDGAFVGHTLDVVGEHAHARSFYAWALRTQETSGGWYQRYFMHGAVAPTWGLEQFDEIGAIVWSTCVHVQQTEDFVYGQKVFPQLAAACEYMQKSLDVETGLAPVTWDLWEEREGISTYACACTWAAFHVFARLSTKLGFADEAARWTSAAGQFKQAIETHLWDASEQRFLRGIKTRISADTVEQLRFRYGLSDANIVSVTNAGGEQFMLLRDKVVDASILGLSVPFGVFSPDDPRMLATAEAATAHLTSPIGGIVRYTNDHYRGGNPWIICTLWLALQYINSGRTEQGYQLYTWALEHRTSLDLFAEQIDRATSEPCWANPLAWSHAMFLLATEACVKQGLLG